MLTCDAHAALRIRPLTERDRAQPRFANIAADDILKVHEKTVHVVPHSKLFTFDHVFGPNSRQSQIFAALGEKLVHKFVEGMYRKAHPAFLFHELKLTSLFLLQRKCRI